MSDEEEFPDEPEFERATPESLARDFPTVDERIEPLPPEPDPTDGWPTFTQKLYPHVSIQHEGESYHFPAGVAVPVPPELLEILIEKQASGELARKEAEKEAAAAAKEKAKLKAAAMKEHEREKERAIREKEKAKAAFQKQQEKATAAREKEKEKAAIEKEKAAEALNT